MDALFTALQNLHAFETHLIFSALSFPACWIVCQRASLPRWWAVLVLLPLVGLAVFLSLLAFHPWNGRAFILKKKSG